MTQTMRHWLFVGGYGTAIETFGFDPSSGQLAPAAFTDGVPEAPTFLALDARRRLLFAVTELGGADSAQPGRAVSYSIDVASGKLTKLSDVWAGGSNAVHVALSRCGNYLLTASSSTAEGRVAVIPVDEAGRLSEPTDSQIAGKNAHGLVQSPDGRFVWVVCRGDERVTQYRFDEHSGKLTLLSAPHATLPVPSGPRHIAVHPTLPVVYALMDWSGEVVTYAYAEDGVLTQLDSVSAFPEGKQPLAATGAMTAAEIEVSKDGKRVYASTRTAECQSISVLEVGLTGALTRRENEPGNGLIRGPRHFVFSADERHLFVANQDADTLLAFAVDPATGHPSLLGGAVATRINKPNALAFGSFG
jgi:6-phosphogluconolactonase